MRSLISGLKVIKLFSCSPQLSMKFFLLINVKMPTIVGILTFMSGKNSSLGLSEPERSQISWYFYTYEHLKFHAQLSWVGKKFYDLGASLGICLVSSVFSVCWKGSLGQRASASLWLRVSASVWQQQTLKSDWANAQTDLSLLGTHTLQPITLPYA